MPKSYQNDSLGIQHVSECPQNCKCRCQSVIPRKTHVKMTAVCRHI